MADFYTYRNKVASRRRKRRMMIVLVIVLTVVLAAAGWYNFHPADKQQGKPTPPESSSQTLPESAAEPSPTPEATLQPTPTPTAAPASAEPRRILPAVDTAVWDTAAPVTQTIDDGYFSTDHRMAAVPMLGTVTKDYFNTVTFVGDSIASGLGIYATGYQNAKYATYISAGVDTFVNNVKVKNAVTHEQETPIEAIAASQPDYVYLLVGTNNLVRQGGEENFIAYYERLIDILRENLDPGVIYYIQSIPAVQEDVVDTKPGLDNARIATVNDMLANMALRKGCYFVNIGETLNNLTDGSQKDEYETADGVHFNPSGYRAWADYLASHTIWNRRSIYAGQNPYYIYGT